MIGAFLGATVEGRLGATLEASFLSIAMTADKTHLYVGLDDSICTWHMRKATMLSREHLWFRAEDITLSSDSEFILVRSHSQS